MGKSFPRAGFSFARQARQDRNDNIGWKTRAARLVLCGEPPVQREQQIQRCVIATLEIAERISPVGALVARRQLRIAARWFGSGGREAIQNADGSQRRKVGFRPT